MLRFRSTSSFSSEALPLPIYYSCWLTGWKWQHYKMEWYVFEALRHHHHYIFYTCFTRRFPAADWVKVATLSYYTEQFICIISIILIIPDLLYLLYWTWPSCWPVESGNIIICHDTALEQLICIISIILIISDLPYLLYYNLPSCLPGESVDCGNIILEAFKNYLADFVR